MPEKILQYRKDICGLLLVINLILLVQLEIIFGKTYGQQD